MSSLTSIVAGLIETLTQVRILVQEASENTFCLAITRMENVIETVSRMSPRPAELAQVLDTALELLLMEVNGPTFKKNVGRPKLELSLPQLEYLLSVGLTTTKIAEFYKVSRYTVHRRLKEYNLTVGGTYTTITDNQLGSIVNSILLQFPNTGYKRMKGYLRAREIKVTDGRVRRIMRTVDPQGVCMRTIRRNQVIRRRTYFVQYSNQLWHIDGNLKLIRWGIVIRCGIDGKSRTATYVSATTNNRSDTHFSAFLRGVGQYGVPLRTRSDKGGENVLIAKFMIENRGVGRSSHICGRSVHNQRIERFWRDVYEACTSTYYSLFWKLEEDGVLDVDNTLHLWILHFVFLPRLNAQLSAFVLGWNNHPLSSESNATPNQIMFLNLPPPNLDLLLSEEDLTDIDFRCDELSDLGRFDSLADNASVDLAPDISNSKLEALQSLNLMGQSESFGMDVYLEAMKIVYGTE